MTAAYFEDHPTDPDKVILRKPYSTDCPNCEYHRQRAQRWREEAYKQAGHPLPEQEPVAWISATELLVMRGNALGGAKDWRVNLGLEPEEGDVGLYTIPLQRTWVGLTDEEVINVMPDDDTPMSLGEAFSKFAELIEAKLKEKNT